MTGPYDHCTVLPDWMPGEPTVLVLDMNDKHAPYDTTRDETTTASIFHENFGEKIEKGLMNKLRL